MSDIPDGGLRLYVDLTCRICGKKVLMISAGSRDNDPFACRECSSGLFKFYLRRRKQANKHRR